MTVRVEKQKGEVARDCIAIIFHSDSTAAAERLAGMCEPHADVMPLNLGYGKDPNATRLAAKKSVDNCDELMLVLSEGTMKSTWFWFILSQAEVRNKPVSCLDLRKIGSDLSQTPLRDVATYTLQNLNELVADVVFRLDVARNPSRTVSPSSLQRN